MPFKNSSLCLAGWFGVNFLMNNVVRALALIVVVSLFV